MRRTLVINLTGAPGAGKSTLAAYIFSRLKMMGVNCELVTEFAKDKTWEKNSTALSNQVYVFANQYYRMSRCADKVDVIITDSPLILSGFYNRDEEIDRQLKDLIAAVNSKYDNLTYMVIRAKPYVQAGRNETEAESDAYVQGIIDLMDKYGVQYSTVLGDTASAEDIISQAVERLDMNTKTAKGER